MILAGIDPSLKGTALCIADTSSLDQFSVCTLKCDQVGVKRLDYLETKTLDMLANKGVELCFIEGYSFGSKGRAVFNIAEWGGILRLAVARQSIPFFEVPPFTLKKFVTGKGNSNKTVMLERTFRRWAIGSEILTDDDQVDAYGLLRFGAAFLQWANKDPDAAFAKYELESFKKITCEERL